MQNRVVNKAENIAGFRALVKCPNCLQPGTLDFGANSTQCVKCGASFSARGGILDFVAGRDNTALNVLAYDNEKHVSLGASLRLFDHLKRVAGGLFRDALGEILEIGAGTGLLTLGMLASKEFDRAVITDISPEMLGVCRARLEESLAPEKVSRVFLATYSGREEIFCDGAYDLCVANSVVHHILDYPAFFANMRKALKPTGMALFVEPAAPFHDSMTLAMSDALAYLLGRGADLSPRDVRVLAHWIAERRSGLMFPDEVTLSREDKHLFWRNDLECAAHEAGFASLTVLPWHFDPLGLSTLQNYANGLGLSQPFREIFFPSYEKFAAYHFRNIAEDDLSSMYVVAMRA
jgi:SAM-dependent methyltransferase